MKSFTILFVLVGLTFFNGYSQNDATKAEQPKKEVTLHIEGMACQFCARSLKNSLSKQFNGVTIHEIDPKKGFAKLSFEKEKLPKDDQLKEAVENAGFMLKEIKLNQEEKPSSPNTDNK